MSTFHLHRGHLPRGAGGVPGDGGHAICLFVVCLFVNHQHDSQLLATSGLPERFERNDLVAVDDAIILGDSAYPSRTWLFTLIDQPANPRERSYNRAHCRTPVTVELALGQLKIRWACLHGLRFRKVENSVLTTMTSCVLHNVAKLQGDNGKWLGGAAARPPAAGPDHPPMETAAVAQRRGFERRQQVMDGYLVA